MSGDTAPQRSSQRPQVLGARNRRVAELRRLIRRRSRDSPEIVLEGPRTVGEALAAGIEPTTVVIPASVHPATAGADRKRPDPGLTRLCEQLPAATELLIVADHVFEQLAPTMSPQPMLALAARPEARLWSEVAANDLVMVLISVSDPGNVGTIVRVADACAALGVVAVAGADPWSPKAVRASAGSALRVPIVMSCDGEAALTGLRQAQTLIVAADAHRGVPHDSGVLAGDQSSEDGRPARKGVAIVLGSEPRGLARSLDALVDHWVRIDMGGRTESLNVAMAATLLAYEARRNLPVRP